MSTAAAEIENKACDRCGVEIPNSATRSMSDIDTYWCDACEQFGSESLEELNQRLSDREALGVEPRPNNPVCVVICKPKDGAA